MVAAATLQASPRGSCGEDVARCQQQRHVEPLLLTALDVPYGHMGALLLKQQQPHPHLPAIDGDVTVARIASTLGKYERSMERPTVPSPEPAHPHLDRSEWFEDATSPRLSGRMLRIPGGKPPSPPSLAGHFGGTFSSGSFSARAAPHSSHGLRTSLGPVRHASSGCGSRTARPQVSAPPPTAPVKSPLRRAASPLCPHFRKCSWSGSPSRSLEAVLTDALPAANADASIDSLLIRRSSTEEDELHHEADGVAELPAMHISPRMMSLATKLDPRSLPDAKDPRARGRISQIVVQPRPERGHVLPRKSQIIRRRPAAKMDMSQQQEIYAASKHAQEESRMAALAAHQIFHGCTAWQLRTLARLGKPQRFYKFATIYREGAMASCIYILVKGALSIDTSDGTSQVIRVNEETSSHGICFGFEGLSMGESRRPNTVTALDETEVLQLSLSGLCALNVSKDDEWVIRVVKRSTELVVEKALRTMPLFHGLANKIFHDLSGIFKIEEIGSAGIIIFRQGGAGNRLYILLSGRVDVLRDGSRLASLAADPQLPRPFFGEMALLDGSARSATVVTAAPSRLLILEQNLFSRFNALVPDFITRLSRIKKLREKHTEIMSASMSGPRKADPRAGPRSTLMMAMKAESVLQM